MFSRAEHGGIRLETGRHGWDRPGSDHPQVKRQSSFKSVKQKRRSFSPKRQKAINEEVGKLLQAKAIGEVEYPEWLANVVLVKKANGKWRLCIDFTDINRACPKDSFPLPWIDLIVDATADHEL